MASSDVCPVQSDSGSLTSNDFCVLEVNNCTSGGMPNGIHNSDMNNSSYDFTNMPSALNTALTDSTVEIQKQLTELHEENSHLKEKINENGKMMEELITSIMSWRDHMIASKNQLESDLNAAKDQIVSLEMEKTGLFEKIDQSLKEMDELQGIRNCVQCTALESSLNGMLTVSSTAASENVFHNWSYFRKNLHGNLTCVCQHLEKISAATTNQQERIMLNCYISILKFKIASLKGDVGELASLQTDDETDYEVVHLKLSEGGVEEMNKTVEELKKSLIEKDKEVVCLKKEKEELAEKIKEHEMKIQEWEMFHKSQYELLTNKLETESALSVKYKERCDNLQQQLEEHQVKLEQNRNRISETHIVKELQDKLQNLEAILKLESENKQCEKKKYNALMEKCEILQVDHDRVTKLLEIQAKDEKEKSEKMSSIENDAKIYMEKADHLTAQLLDTKEQLSHSETEIQKLQDQFSKINDLENIELLKAQIEIYKKDYFDLEAVKNAATEELERLKNKLHQYEQSDVGSLSARGSPRHHHRRSRDGSLPEQNNQDGAAAQVTCPICGMGFTEEKAATNHINRCIEEKTN